MISDQYCERISDDWLWRERDLRDLDAMLLKNKDKVAFKSAILITYSHWEGHFKHCAYELLGYITEGISRKIFKWTDVKPEIRERILFCCYRKSSLSGQNFETFISYLNALHNSRFVNALSARNEIIMIDDNLNSLRAEAICRNFGMDYAWVSLKKIIIDERLLDHRNAIAHGSQHLRSGDKIDYKDPLVVDAMQEVRSLIRESKHRFSNAISAKQFLSI